MGLQIPDQLAGLLYDLGFLWPTVDEEKLYEAGLLWVRFGGDAGTVARQANDAALRVSAVNTGSSVEAFTGAWAEDDAPHAILADGATGAYVVGACLFACAGLVLALKITVIVLLSMLLAQVIQALLAGPGSALLIPVYRKFTAMALNALFNRTATVLLG